MTGSLPDGILMASAPDGSLYVAIPRRRGAVLVRLDGRGSPAAGWPVAVPRSNECSFLGAADDGSVRAICDATDIEQPEWCCDTARAFAFDRDGRLIRGWPVEVPAWSSTRVIGRELVLLATEPFTDAEEIGVPSHRSWLRRIRSDGAVTTGTEVEMVAASGQDEWAIGPDGVAYGTESVGDWHSDGRPIGEETSRVLAMDEAGARVGWPVVVDGAASGPTFAPDGRIIITVGTFNQYATRVVALRPGGGSPAATSAVLPLMTAETGVDCGTWVPGPPVVAGDGTVFLDGISDAGSDMHALDRSLAARAGWPWRPATSIQWTGTVTETDGLQCQAYAVPATGPDSTLYVPLAAASESTGGSLTAVGLDGRIRAGWPVKLTRPGAGFWSVVTGSDGTVFALAVEPERRGHSATVLAIAPDSTVRWNTTVIEP